ncbi:MAG: signal peptide peptidase SppA, partial [Flavobacteriaceae bacterium]|nr:signal peptide peptidase SppA [Flavobacteriaceae bacterium]
MARTAPLAKESKLIDKIAYYDEYINALKYAVGIDKTDKLKTITIEDYSNHVANKRLIKSSKDKIAVIYAEGMIIYGQGEEGIVGQGAINKSLKKAREDEDVKAIVLRVNSPGGSALASELIWRELELTKAVKPLIVSMGDVAASGGYYIACNADKIFAEKTSITGSIGVFGTLPNVNELADNIGINAEQVTTNKNAVTYSIFEPMNADQRFFIKEGINDVYELFTNRVAEGRGMKQDEVKAIAEGRVWTGVSAVENGLVDEIGGLDDALEYAASIAEIETYKIKEFPVFERNLDEILEGFGLVKSKESILKEELGEENYKILKEIKNMSQQKGIQLLFPFDTEIK